MIMTSAGPMSNVETNIAIDVEDTKDFLAILDEIVLWVELAKKSNGVICNGYKKTIFSSITIGIGEMKIFI